MKTLCTFLLLTILPAPLALAAPAWLSEVNMTKPGPFTQLKPTQLVYDVTWNGRVTAGQAYIRFGFPDARYPRNFIVQSYGGTTGVARRLFQFDFNYSSFLRPGQFRPQVFHADEREKDRHKITETRFNKTSVTATETKRKLPKGKTKVSSSTFSYQNALDVQSAVFWVRSLDMKEGQEAVFVIMPFKTPYLCRVRNLGGEVLSTYRTIKYDLRLQKIDKKTLALESYDKMKSLELWVSDDAERIPLEVRSKVFIGDVRVVLSSKSYK